MSLFGKSATELNPMIEAGSDALRDFSDEAHDMGYVLDKDALKALGRVQDEFDRFQRQMESVKNQIGAGVAPAIERGMKRIQQTVSNIDWTKIGRQIGKAFDVPVHGRCKAGDVDYAFWVPGGNHLWHCLVQANPRGIDNHGVHF